ncbi:hypothetical protein [Hwangdonia sp.]|uniref:hypothetical protein n=1 Tax=Hwangdonia sp. TaxID=1883432 RepID=UPI003AB7F9CA
MYQNIFAIDEISFQSRKEKKETCPQFILNNYEYYNPKLESDFYLKYFIRELLFDIDILDVNDFLSTHYDNSKNPTKLLNVIRHKILPCIDTIISNAKFSINEGGYYKETKLEDGFVETEGVVKNQRYEYFMFFHITAVNNLEADLKERKVLITNFIENSNNIEAFSEVSSLKWIGKPSHLAFIISQLIDEGYIDAPMKNNNEINHTELSRMILKLFSFQKPPSKETIRKYLNVNEDKHVSLKNSFINTGFHLPNSGLLG